MNKTFYSAKDHSPFVRPISLVLFLLSTLIAFLGALLLFNTPVIGNVATAIINIGLDPLRAQLVAALLLVAGAALVGAALGRQRVGAIIGAGIAFWPGYLANFIHLEQQPAYDPGGRLEALDQQALLHTAIVMVALALLSGFIGAAVGKAVGEVLLDPFYQLGALTWNRFFRPGRATSLWATKATTPLPTRPKTALEMTGSWLGVAIMVILLVLASGSGDLLLFSPDVGLHSVPTQSKTHDTPVQGAVVEDSLASPAAGGQKRAFLIYLPPSYSTPQGRTRRYPSLYLLHGSPGSQRDWFTGGKAAQSADTLIAQGEIPELIMISPDGNGRSGETSEWGNSFDKRQNIETFVAVDLVNYVDHKYRTIADTAHRAIGGLSMGGFGAMNIAVHHPDIFGSVISLGGYYQAEGSIWGKNAAYMQANSPAFVLPHEKLAWKLHMYIGAATKDEPYYNYTKQFVQELAKLHITYHLDVQNGYHAWNVWQAQLYHALIWLRWQR
jgi:enterochelin esterase-like enzyme